MFARTMEGLAAEAEAPRTVMTDAAYKAPRTASSLRAKKAARGAARAAYRAHERRAEQALLPKGPDGIHLVSPGW